MGREIKRVVKDFNWPLKKVWNGYLNPWYKYNHQCQECRGSGYNKETKKIDEDWYAFDKNDYIYLNNGKRYNNSAWQYHITQDEVEALIRNNRLMEFTHRWTKENGWQKIEPPIRPSAKEVNDWAIYHPMGHDSINQFICVKARAKRLGVYGLCEKCNGEGNIWVSSDYEQKAKDWKREEPPIGTYYQLWETTSEGSPLSPPLETPEELAQWLTNNSVKSFGSQVESYEIWLKFICGPKWAPSAVGAPNLGLRSGVSGYE